MSGPSEFQRVKSLWQTRVGREAPPPPVQEMAVGTRESVIDNKVDLQTPHTPLLNADFHKYTIPRHDAVPDTRLDETSSVSPVSTSSTIDSTDSPSSAFGKTSSNPVTSMLRTFSDACVFPSMKSRRPHAAASAPTSTSSSSSVPSTFLSFAPPMPIAWRSSRSASDCSSSSSTRSTFPFGSVHSTSSLLPREAAENAINNVYNVCSRYRTAVSNSIFRGSPYGEVVVVDILAARGLAIDRDVDSPVVLTLHLSQTSRKTRPTGCDKIKCSVNERFVFWLPSSPTNDQRTVDVFVHGNDGHDLGEVHFSLAMPLNETFADSYPLVCRSDGLKHGSIQVAMRRLVLTSLPMLETAKTLSDREGCLSFSESKDYGDSLPELWLCFPGTGPEVIAACGSKEDDISSKLGRLIGFQDAAQRDIF